MPPRKSKKRTKPKAPTPPTFEGLPVVNNTSFQQYCKALYLPLELLMEILSYFKGIRRPSTNTYIHNASNNLSDYLERTDVTRALSQTCRFWRHTLLPVLWESLDVCATHSNSKAWYQVFGETLIRKCSLMIANPEIASHVRTVNVILTRYSAETVLPAFVQGLEALPNFRVLCIASAHQKMTTALKDVFEDHTFPQVESIFLPPYCHNILRSCPSVRKVACNDGDDASKLVSAIAKECKLVEEVDGFAFHEETTIERSPGFLAFLVHSHSQRLIRRVGQGNSKASFVEIPSPIDVKIVEPLAACKNLSHITLQSTKRNFDEAMSISAEMEVVNKATEIIRKSPSTERKTLVLSFCKNYAHYREEPMPEFWSKTWEL